MVNVLTFENWWQEGCSWRPRTRNTTTPSLRGAYISTSPSSGRYQILTFTLLTFDILILLTYDILILLNYRSKQDLDSIHSTDERVSISSLGNPRVYAKLNPKPQRFYAELNPISSLGNPRVYAKLN